MTKLQSMKKIAQEIESCRICRKDKIGLPVVGEGSLNARIMFLGEAPGKNEAKTGRPFIGRSGQLLRSQIREIGLDEKDVYITSPVKYLPLRGTPTKEDINHGNIHLNMQIEIIRPKIIVLLGKTAAFSRLGYDVPIAKDHATTKSKDGLLYFIAFHPAAAIRFQKFMQVFKEDFVKLRQFIYTE